MTQGGWERNEVYILKTLERIEKAIEGNTRDIVTLKIKVFGWAFAVSAIVSGALSIGLAIWGKMR